MTALTEEGFCDPFAKGYIFGKVIPCQANWELFL